MADNSSGLPPAGWYADPAGSGLERWWGGVDWTETTRPKELAIASAPAAASSYGAYAAAPTASYGFADATAGAYAGIGSQSAGAYGGVATLAPASTIGVFQADPQASIPKVAASWYDPKLTAAMGPPPTNGAATAALVLAIVSWFINPLLILTFVSRHFAKRGLENASIFEYESKPPAGRARARWARGITGAYLTLFALGLAGAGWLYYQYGIYHDYVIEAEFDKMATAEGLKGASLDCPTEGSYEAGSVILCTLTAPNGATEDLRIVVKDPWTRQITASIVQ